jgi:hypothetical protein
MTQIIGMAKRLQEAEATIAELRRALERKGSTVDVKPVVSTSADQDQNQDQDAAMADPPMPAASYAAPSRAPHSIEFLRREQTKGMATEELLSGLSLDESGMVAIIWGLW